MGLEIGDAVEPKTMTTYRMANGDLIFGEYGFVNDPDYFDEVDQPTEVVREKWSLIEAETIIFGADEDDEDYEDVGVTGA